MTGTVVGKRDVKGGAELSRRKRILIAKNLNPSSLEDCLFGGLV